MSEHRTVDGTRRGGCAPATWSSSTVRDDRHRRAVGDPRPCRRGRAKLLLVGDHKQPRRRRRRRRMDLLATAGSRYELAGRPLCSPPSKRDAFAPPARAATSRCCAPTTEARAATRRRHPGDQADSLRGDGVARRLPNAGRRSLPLVDSNEQAGRLSASPRAEPVRLGGSTSTASRSAHARQRSPASAISCRPAATAGIWLGSRHRRGPINRGDLPRHRGIRDDGRLRSLTVTTSTGAAGVDGAASPATSCRAPRPRLRQHRARRPGHHRRHHALGDQSSAHRACRPHVAMSRGRTSTPRTSPLAPVPTTAPTAPPTVNSVHRDPVATLAGIPDTSDQATPRSALTIATESATDANSSRTAAELFADAAQLAATEPPPAPDQLVDSGALSDEQRNWIAAEDGTGALT
ncbi:hypothetical protein HBB16_04950 [Pseudonocardia sp. MCCB 268]|nr:hypothetical protein [Pseudonocardia cytotoxica]